MSAENTPFSFDENVIIPDSINIVDDRLYSYYKKDGLNACSIIDLDADRCVSIPETPSVVAESPDDEHHRALLEEAGPDGTMHHSV